MNETAKTILAVDDEPVLLDGIVSYLAAHGYRMVAAKTGAEALALFDREAPDLVLLDLMLPDIGGEEVCRRIRARSRTPVIMVTAKTAEDSIVEGLSAGADGYVTKPFSLKELLARIEAILRRAAEEGAPLAAAFSFGGGDLTADFVRGEFKKAGRLVKLTRAEQALLAAFAAQPGRVFTRDALIEAALGGIEFAGFDRTVDAHVKNLRRKIETDPRRPAYIQTVFGIGYRFTGGVEAGAVSEADTGDGA
jgi:DNA-binding response OmpR family regulator